MRWLRGLGRGKASQAVSLRAKHRLLAFSLNWRSGISNLCAYLCVSVSSEPRYTYLRDEAYEASLTPRSEAMQTSICRHLSSMWVAVAILAGCNSGGSQLAPSDSMQQRGAQFDRVIQSTVVASAARDSHRISPDGIVYTSANVKIENSQFNLDLNNDGTTDFSIAEANNMYQIGCGGRGGPRYTEYGELSLAAEDSNGFEVNDGYAAKLIGGSLIGARQSFSSVKSWIEYRIAGYDEHCVFYHGEDGIGHPAAEAIWGWLS